MKKHFLKFTALLFVVASLTSCEEDQVVYSGTSGDASLAAFRSPSGSLAVIEGEASETTITVDVSTASDVERTIAVSIDPASTALANQYNIVASTLVIPANSYNGYIKVTGNIENLAPSEHYTLILNLDTLGDSYVEPSKNRFQLDIFQSCPYDLADVGTSFTGAPYAFDEFAPEFVPTITQSATDPSLFTFSSLWGPNFVSWATGNPAYDGQYVYPGTIQINPDLSLTITGGAGYATGGTGTYDPCTNSFSMTLNQELFSDPFTVDVVFTAN
jgi:hypothetical protein